MRPKSSALDRAREDLQAGRPDLARDRLTGYLYTLHQKAAYSQEAYGLLGESYFAMRDLPKAGAAWLLTEHTGADVDAAVQALEKRYGNQAYALLRAVKPRAPSELYPPAVQARLRTWDYQYKPYRSRTHPRQNADLPLEEETKGLRPIEIGCLGVVVLFGALVAWWILKTFVLR